MWGGGKGVQARTRNCRAAGLQVTAPPCWHIAGTLRTRRAEVPIALTDYLACACGNAVSGPRASHAPWPPVRIRMRSGAVTALTSIRAYQKPATP